MYSCTRDDFALLIAVDTPPRSTRLCRPEVISLWFMIAVDTQLSRLMYRPGRHGCVVQKCFRFSFFFAVDLQMYRAGDVQLHQR